MPWNCQGEKRKCEERKGTGSREREKEKDGNGKDGRIYPLEDIWDYLSIAPTDFSVGVFLSVKIL